MSVTLRIAQPPQLRGEIRIKTGGQEVPVTLLFKYMGARELSAFLDRVAADARPVRLADILRRLCLVLLGSVPGLKAWATRVFKPRGTQAEHLMTILDGWENVDTEFSVSAVATLCDLYPSAYGLIVEAWSKAIADARLGN